jgi:hypothetical protein
MFTRRISLPEFEKNTFLFLFSFVFS